MTLQHSYPACYVLAELVKAVIGADYLWGGKEWDLNEKKAIIRITLVKEAGEKTNDEIEKEILEGLSSDLIPWCKEIESVKIIESKSLTRQIVFS